MGKHPAGEFQDMVLRHSQTRGNLMQSYSQTWCRRIPRSGKLPAEAFPDMGRCGAEAFPQAGKYPAEPFPNVVVRHSQMWGDMVLIPNVVLRHSQTRGDMVLRDLLMWENVLPSNSQMWSQTWGDVVLRRSHKRGNVLLSHDPEGRHDPEAFADLGKHPAGEFPDMVLRHSQTSGNFMWL